MAIGYEEQNNSIYIVGGGSNPQSLVRYDLNPSTNQILSVYDYGATYFNVSMNEFNQWYTQLSNVLYMLPGNDDAGIIHRLFLSAPSTPTIDYNYTNIPGYLHQGCITSVSLEHDYLISIGGDISGEEPSSRTRIFDITDHQWITVTNPRLNTPRRRSTCQVVDQTVYVMGGKQTNSGNQYLNSIETLDISDIFQITSYSWKTYGITLSRNYIDLRSIVYGTDIFCMAGYSVYGGFGDRGIDVIDTVNKRRQDPGNLNYGASGQAVILIYPYIYAFGGGLGLQGNGGTAQGFGGYTNQYQYHRITLSVYNKN